MVKRTAAALAALLAVLPAAPAPGQVLQRLTVQSFELSADTTSPRIETPFHLVVSLRVRQRVAQIANLNLPLLAQLELLGDERVTTSSANGTQYRETITVVAHDAGAVAIEPATLQAIDARDGKPKEWFTNALTLHVAGPAPASVLGAALGTALRVGLRLLLWVIAIACIVFIVILLLRRRRRRPAIVVAPPPAPPPPMRVRSQREQAQDALAVLRKERTRPAAVVVRGAIWRMVGASDGETLGDVLRRTDSRDEMMRGLLIALERSAFTYDQDLQAAIEDACSALERFVGSVA